ncbi:ABC transporter substrate-binding protein [Paenibacillus sp. PsM32]|uniref:ABC transporter substrate-binding protein n=1 Tax=Paenibacillus sp. PsM32 TaxID=3030536 RepID=UPI00263A77FB|nr:ABC transporter substrate-binding protein [Paenibacillus sp. PsM32]MDN4620470.1 ABC transporter substrate-binding protein [Paenibacillus sp. PsM32]
MYSIKKVSIILTTIVLIAILAACGQSTTPTSSTSISTSTDTPATTNKTITYKAANGEVQVPGHPQRVVVIADSYYGYLYALGIKPIATIDYVFQSAILKETTEGVTNLGNNPDVEKVLALNPDLIVVWDNDENIENYEQIAPTVAIKYGQYTYKELLQEFGKMTGTEDKAKEVAAAWETKINKLKPQVQAAVGDKTVSILQPYAKGIYAMGDTYGRGGEIIYQALGLKGTPMLQKEAIDSGKGFASLSLENLPDFAGDYIFTSPWGGDGDKDGSNVYNSSLWKDLPAVKNNHVFKIDPVAYYFNDPISMNGQLDYIVKCLTQS